MLRRVLVGDAMARIAGEFYVNAINVMRGASGVDRYVGLDEQEAFDIEYWLLEEAKLQRMPRPKALAGHVALITGGQWVEDRNACHTPQPMTPTASSGATLPSLNHSANPQKAKPKKKAQERAAAAAKAAAAPPPEATS